MPVQPSTQGAIWRPPATDEPDRYQALLRLLFAADPAADDEAAS